MVGRAIFSPDRQYRYLLERRWARGYGSLTTHTCLFIMLNPSIADEHRLDPTVRRCVGFAQQWGFHRLLVGNACALVSTDWRAIRSDPDPVGNPENDTTLRWMARRSSLIVLAWGAHLSSTRAQEVVSLVQSVGRKTFCLGTTLKGAPLHPLYLPYSRRLEPYDP